MLFFINKVFVFFHETCLYFYEVPKRWYYNLCNKTKKTGKKMGIIIAAKQLVKLAMRECKSLDLCWL